MNFIVKNLPNTSIIFPNLLMNPSHIGRIIRIMVRLIYIPALILSMLHVDLIGYLLVLFIGLILEFFAIPHITSVMSLALHVKEVEPSHQDELLKINEYFQPLPDDWHDKIKHAVAANEFHCGNCGRPRSGYSITQYPHNQKCEQCD